MARKALVVGIDHYDHAGRLYGCVNDAHSVKALLERNGDGSVNCDVRLLTGNGPGQGVSRARLKDQIAELFNSDGSIALLYFAGHGDNDSLGGYIIASDSQRVDDGVGLDDIVTMANQCKAQNRIIMLDSCRSGFAGRFSPTGAASVLNEGMTILTAATEDQYAQERDGGGVFTRMLVDGLNGGAANLLGQISASSVYAHVDQSLGEWGQRPVFKTNVKKFACLRRVAPAVLHTELQRLPEFFPAPGAEFKLDPSFEPEMGGRTETMPPPNPDNVQRFALLQKLNRVNLVVPVDAPHMWHAAMQSKACRLTVQGEHYRQLVEKRRI
jgi:hypothetical protein